MKSMSDHLADLATRSKQIEDSLSAARDKNVEMLAGRRKALEAAVTHAGERLEDAGDDLAIKVKAPWKHARTAVERTFATVRVDADQRRVHKDLAKAERHADHAEQDAADAAALAVFVLDQTEYTVAEAVLARADADELAAAGTDAAGRAPATVASA